MPLLFAAMFILFLSACSKNPPEEAKKKNPPPTDQVSEDEENKDSFQFPLTGIETDKESDRRAVAAMINNHPTARPQSGLSKADIVYEVLAEGSITRFLAIFQSEIPDNIGPIRSARDYFIELAEGYNSLYIAHGYSPEAKQILLSGSIDHLNGMNYDGTLFKRATFRKAPHNSYITYDNIEKGAEAQEYDMAKPPAKLEFLNEDEVDKINGEKAESVTITYNPNSRPSAKYEFDQKSGKYFRYSDGEQTVEYETEQPVQLDNVIVIETTHSVIDSAGRRSIDLTSGGKAYLFQKGIMKNIEWKNQDGRVLPFEDGQLAKLVPGKTWINIVPKMENVSYSE
ncbi:DUF3048 domain-containing protein [Lederbergia citrea]|uniref:DUF3048 domain-containing protein n=1 Tax=Lederbergia citrea TaxID=2833581 RepID=UPI001BC92452|nr:DUF3048 domain-containing protein [Lederbergia citrea]MBS4206135.1 DUF3048 domain-containing protein [Lederbergia citrea]